MKKTLFILIFAIAVFSVFVSCNNNTDVVTYKVTVKNGEEVYKERNIADGDIYVLPAKPADSRPFKGWKVGESTELMQPGEDLKITGDTEITAVWVTSCTVSFNLGDVSLTPIPKMTVDYGTVNAAPSVPHRAGYVFSNWEIKNGGIFDFRNPITQNLELEAVWTQIKTNLTVYFPKNVNDVETIKVDVDGVVRTFSYSEGEEDGDYKKYTAEVTGLDHGTHDISLTTLKGNDVVGGSYTDSVNMKYDITDKEVKVDTSNVVDISTSVPGKIQATTISGDATNGYVISGTAKLSYGDGVTLLYSNDGNEPSDSYTKDESITVSNKLRLKATPTDSTKWSKGRVNSAVTFNTTIGAKGPAGGIIFYDATKVQTVTYTNSSGESVSYSYRFLEASPDVLSGTYPFNGSATYHNTEADIGRGKANTALLKETMTASDYSGSAVEKCVSYNGGNNSDWFLPSQDEYSYMYKIKDKIGGFDSSFSYWTSSEFDSDKTRAFSVQFKDSELTSAAAEKTTPKYVRPARCF